MNFKQYLAFGETTLDTLGVTRQGYIGKEKDVENGLGDHGVRKYDYETGRFNSPDVLWEKFYGWNLYQYCFNNPVRYYDRNGLLPGDPFESEADAAHDFGKNYGNLSFALGGEISTSIYKYQEGENTLFTYAVPNITSKDHGSSKLSTIDKEGYVKTASAHTHGRESANPDVKPNEFSSTDKAFKINLYLVAPNGTLQLFNPETNKSTTLTKDMPKDNGEKSKEFWKRVDNNPDKRPLPIKMTTQSHGFYDVNDAKKQVDRGGK